MAKQLKLRRGTTSQHSSFTGAEGEVTVDTTKDTLVVHDGSTAGGHPLVKESAEVTSTGIADNVIDEANLKVSNSPTNGYALTAQSGNTGGLTWAALGGGTTWNSTTYNLYTATAGNSNGGTTNIALGLDAGDGFSANSSDLIAIGTSAGYRAPDWREGLIYIGNEAGKYSTGDKVTYIGNQCGRGVSGQSTGYQNTGLGWQALKNHTSGYYNTALGAFCLDDVTTGFYNVGVGITAGGSITTGSYNTLIGPYPGSNLTTGDNNTLIGKGAQPSSSSVSNEITLGNTDITKFRIPGINFILKDNGGTPSSGQVLTADGSGEGYWADAAASISSDAQYNTIGGTNAGDSFSGTDAIKNTLFGYDAGTSITTGDQNTFVGFEAGKNVTGDYCIGIGSDSLKGSSSGATGDKNLGIGAVGSYLTTGHDNVGVGHYSNQLMSTGYQNTSIGTESAAYNQTGHNNVSVGHRAGHEASGNYNTNVGTEAAYSGNAGHRNTNIGYSAGKKMRTSNDNTAVGAYAGGGNITNSGTPDGQQNASLGRDALGWLTSGDGNVAVGYKTLSGTQSTPQTGDYNVAVGYGAGQYNMHNGSSAVKTDYNIGIGYYAAAASTADHNIGIGYEVMRNQYTSMPYNIGIGYKACRSITSAQDTIAIGREALGTGILTGNNNIAIGFRAGTDSTSASGNTLVGYEAGKDIDTGGDNTIIGYAGRGVTSGTNNLLLGSQAGGSSAPSGNITTGSNTICLGNNSIADFYCADTSISSSDSRDKTDVTNFTHGLDWINKLNPITYRWDKRCWYSDDLSTTPDGSKKTARQHIGFLAQDVLAIEQADGFASKKDDMLVVNLNEDDTAYGLKYERLVPVLVNAIKELSAKVTALEAK